MLLPIVVILYIVSIAPAMDRTYQEVINSIRQVILIDDEQFYKVCKEASKSSPIGEATAIGIGLIVGLLMSRLGLEESVPSLLTVYWSIAMSLMFGLLVWTIYNSISDMRLITELHRQPMHVDLFNTQLYDPIGRQSLLLALVFIGGTLLGVVFGLNIENIYAWQTWLVYIPFGLVAVLLFFLNMRATHRVLKDEKERELDVVRTRIHLLSREVSVRLSLHTENRFNSL